MSLFFYTIFTHLELNTTEYTNNDFYVYLIIFNKYMFHQSVVQSKSYEVLKY